MSGLTREESSPQVTRILTSFLVRFDGSFSTRAPAEVAPASQICSAATARSRGTSTATLRMERLRLRKTRTSRTTLSTLLTSRCVLPSRAESIALADPFPSRPGPSLLLLPSSLRVGFKLVPSARRAVPHSKREGCARPHPLVGVDLALPSHSLRSIPYARPCPFGYTSPIPSHSCNRLAGLSS